MNNLVRRINVPVICDMYTCGNRAEFEIGHELVKASNIHLCGECLAVIIKEGAAMLNISAETTSKTENVKAETENGITSSDIVETTEEIPTKVYECRYCKRTYTDLKEYRSHISKCSRVKKEDK